MTDIAWDFETNDFKTFDGDFAIADPCGRQNGTLILLKSAVNIFLPQTGTALEERYANITDPQLSAITAEAKRQIENDGADTVSIQYVIDKDGETSIDMQVRYKGE